MSIRRLAIALVVPVLALGCFALRRSSPPPAMDAAPGDAGATPPDPLADAPAADPGVSWKVPESWTPGPGRPMRLATYRPAAGASGGNAECAVFHFGEGPGGRVRRHDRDGLEPVIPR